MTPRELSMLFNLSCKEASRLASESFDRDLSRYQNAWSLALAHAHLRQLASFGPSIALNARRTAIKYAFAVSATIAQEIAATFRRSKATKSSNCCSMPGKRNRVNIMPAGNFFNNSCSRFLSFSTNWRNAVIVRTISPPHIGLKWSSRTPRN